MCLLFADLAMHLTDSNRGKHFIGDFLPPDELERFMETFRVNYFALSLFCLACNSRNKSQVLLFSVSALASLSSFLV